MDLRRNYIGTLTNDSFVAWPHVKTLLLSFNRVHTIQAGSLAVLGELETLDLTQNAIREVPAGLPGSLVALYLSNNPVTDTRNLDGAVELRVLHLRRCELDRYPALARARNLVELDVSDNGRIAYVSTVQLAGTCKLTRLNVTNVRLFPGGRAGSHCRSRRVIEWARAHDIRVSGLGPGPQPLPADRNAGDDDPANGNCTRAPDEARAAFEACVAAGRAATSGFAAVAVFACLVVFVAVFARRLIRAWTAKCYTVTM